MKEATFIPHIAEISKWISDIDSEEGFTVSDISIWVEDWCELIGCHKYAVYWLRNGHMVYKEFILRNELIDGEYTIRYHSHEMIM